MIILAVDPGYDRLGIAIIEKNTGKEILIYSECFITDKKSSIYERMFLVGKKISEVIKKYTPTHLSIELLYIENNKKTAMHVSETRGIILYEAFKNKLEIAEFTPLQIKMAVTGNGRSQKTEVGKMVPFLIKLPSKKMIDDEIDAIACGLTFFAYNNNLTLAKKQNL